MYFDYETENNLFDITINNGKFISNDEIQSIDITEDKLIIIFRGMNSLYHTSENFENSSLYFNKIIEKIEEPIDKEKIISYFTNEYINVQLKEFNKQGKIIKETIYHNCKADTITAIDDIKYKLILKINTKDTDLL